MSCYPHWHAHTPVLLCPAALQVHLRHLVGGRARGAAGELLNERIFQVDFPERPGALRRFLGVLCPRWNVSLFHYRRTGEACRWGMPAMLKAVQG